jgi:hypothetical protein
VKAVDDQWTTPAIDVDIGLLMGRPRFADLGDPGAPGVDRRKFVVHKSPTCRPDRVL